MHTNEPRWKRMYAEWEPRRIKPIPGYTILMMVPGDLPVFLKIALEVCATQDPEHLVETLVIPDHCSPGFVGLFESLSKNYRIAPIHLVKLKPFEQAMADQLKNPHINNWLQLVRGVEAIRTTHGLWHDADLFITEPSFLKMHYELCRDRDLACLGVSRAWDTWYDQQGIRHIVATWEMVFNIKWIQNFRPWEHCGHDGFLGEKKHSFDTTLWPQCQTQPEQIGCHGQEHGFIHFNYVICTYRWFQRSKGPFEDEYFRLLLIRLLIDAYDRSGWCYELLSLDELTKGMTDGSNRVTYVQERTKRHYPVFRSKLQSLFDSGLLDEEKIFLMQNGVRPFDQMLGQS